MNVKINGMNLKITEGMKTAIHSKLNSIEKFVKENEVSVKVTQKKLEVKTVIMVVYNGTFIKITERDEDFYVCLEKAVDTLKTKLKKLHTLKVKQDKDHSETLYTYFTKDLDESYDEPKIVKRKSLDLTPLTEIDAMSKMEELGHTSFTFVNIDLDNKICHLYRRNDGNYGILES